MTTMRTITKLSPMTKQYAEILDFMLSNCVMGIKPVPGVQHYDHVLMVMHLYVIEEDHSDVVWEQTPAPKPRLYPKLRQDPTPYPLQDPPQDWQYLQRLASVQPNKSHCTTNTMKVSQTEYCSQGYQSFWLKCFEHLAAHVKTTRPVHGQRRQTC